MSDTPDFDNMSPEEMMRWMESLAKRQGADPNSFTTDADMEVVEISEDDERLGETGEYIPYGWTKEKWEAHLAKEAEEKAARAATPPSTIPDAPHDEEHTKPLYTPEPMAELDDDEAEEPVAAELEGDMPDFDSMSPEEAMRWMESLAKRQGADPSSFLTEADLEVEEVSADDERLQSMGEYIPHGWTQERWEAHLAKEAEEKASKQAAASKDNDLLPSFDEVDDFDYEAADEDYELVGEYDDDLTYELDEDDFPTDFDEDNVIDLDEGDEEEFVMEEELDDEDEPQTLWATIASGDEDDIGEEFNLEELTASEDESYDFDEVEETTETAANPMSWLQELAGDESSEELDLSALEGLEEEQPTGTTDPMGWLAELAQETKGDAVPDLQNLDLGDIGSNLSDLDALAATSSSNEDDEGENPIAWIESLARDQGAPSEELSTSADIPIERPQNFTPDGPGYEPYSFETGGKPPVDEDEDEPETYIDEDELEAIDMSDPSAWLDSLAAGVAGSRAQSQDDDDDYDFDDDEDDIELARAVGEAPKADATETMSRLNSGENVSPEEMENFFDAMFQQAEQYSDRDVDFDDEDDLPSEAIEADIPDWLQAQMADDAQTAESISEDMSAEEANAMLESLFGTGETEVVEAGVDDSDYDLDEELSLAEDLDLSDDVDFLDLETDLTMDIHSEDFLAEADELDFSDEDLPDWLREDVAEDASPDLADIFDDDDSVETPSVAAMATQTDDFPMEISDTWVEAFEVEADPGRQQELAAWYAEQIGQEAPTGATLQTADLPLERNLPLGEAQAVPGWMVTSQMPPATEQPFVETEPEAAAQTGLPNWLSDEDDSEDMPDWLQTDAVDAVDVEELPDWLNIDAEVELEDIPDWLRETMDEDEEAVVINATPQAPVEDVPTPAPAIPQPAIVPVQEQRSPAPVPVTAAQIDVAAVLQNARNKASSGDVASSLGDYELVIRSNSALDEVVGDLQKISESDDQKKNPAVFRVLGDGLMRQGKLQTALETYRKALKML